MTTTPGYTVDALLQAIHAICVRLGTTPEQVDSYEKWTLKFAENELTRTAELTQVTAQSAERASPAKDGGEQISDGYGWISIETRPKDKQLIAYFFEPFKSWHVGRYDAIEDSVSGRSGFTTVIPEVPFWFPIPTHAAAPKPEQT